MNRKSFLKRIGLLAAGVGLSKSVFGESCCSETKPKVIGVQLWSVRQPINQNLSGALKGLANCGYLAIEGFGYNNSQYFNTNINEFDKMVRDCGMKITSSHLSTRFTPESLTEALDWWKDTADKHKAIGCNTMVLPSLPSQRGRPMEVDFLAQVCEYINKVNEIAVERGMRAGFHNHAVDERVMENGKVVFDYLIENTHPSFFIQLDNHNMSSAGRCPVEFIHRYKERIKQLHVKDDDIIGASGKINFEELFTAAANYNIFEPIVEVENYPVDVMECMCRSFDYLNAASYVRFFG